ncbi:MAG: pantetheine-phosphate adenylyltransferase [bacterium]
MRIAVYPGSFDPITKGHVDVIERASKLFDIVYVAVVANPEKRPTFDVGERTEMIKKSIGHVGNIKVDSFDGLLIKYVKSKKSCAIIRGLRAVSDFDYEFQMALTNRKMYPEAETIFLMTDSKYSYLNSGLVRQIAKMGGDVSMWVTEFVKKKLKIKYPPAGRHGKK